MPCSATATRDMHERKSKPFNQPRLNAVIATRRDVTSRSLYHFAQCFSFLCCCRFHITFPFSLLWILTQWLASRGIRLVLFTTKNAKHTKGSFFILRTSCFAISFENTEPASPGSSRSPQLGHSSMECWNLG